uniref:Uncharacterized protein n=1 Tax=Anguilla anguilla TaxID=7936 RepID=A0A0E9TBG7_ANGAN
MLIQLLTVLIQLLRDNIWSYVFFNHLLRVGLTVDSCQLYFFKLLLFLLQAS